MNKQIIIKNKSILYLVSNIKIMKIIFKNMIKKNYKIIYLIIKMKANYN